MGEDEISGLLDRIAEKIAKRGKGVEKRVMYDVVGVDSPHGIYVYDKEMDKWVLIRRDDGGFKPEEDGVYIIYFDNTMCPACRIYDLSWYPYVKLFGRLLEKTHFVIILCAWFAHKCDSEAAKRSFKDYNIHASPTTLLLCIKNGEVKREERIEGVKKLDYLVDSIGRFIKECNKVI